MASERAERVRQPVLLIHGGAGPTTRSILSPAQRATAREGLGRALVAGQRVLLAGGGALEAVLEAVAVLEDEPSFNAGRGAVLRDDGAAVLDASVMRGADRSAGAAAGLRRVRNPIRAAEWVRSQGRYVLLVGDRADEDAARAGLRLEDPSYFVLSERETQLELARRSGRIELDRAEPAAASGCETSEGCSGGTVGAVALDCAGHLAAATSTGGMTNAAAHRVGDSPLIGAGTWADDRSCAVSATGAGEAFIRAAFAHQVSARILFGASNLQEACDAALGEALSLGGRGGCIAVGADGAFSMPFNTPCMPRGCVRGEADAAVALFAEEALVPV